MNFIDEQQRALARPRDAPAPSSKIFFSSLTPEKIAEIWMKANFVSCASSRATVVLPVPGGPQKIRLPSEPEAMRRVSAPSGPTRWSWPTTSAERFRAQTVGERVGRALFETRGGEEIAHH